MFKYRCSSCDNVSDPEITNSNSEHVPHQQYFPDPIEEDQFICGDCQASIDDVMAEWSIIDEAKEQEEQRKLEEELKQQRKDNATV